jgi:hypothetical protein
MQQLTWYGNRGSRIPWKGVREIKMHLISKETVKQNMPAVDVQHLLHLLIFTSTTDIENSTIPCQGQRNHYTCKKTTNAWYLNFWQQGNGKKCTDFLRLTWYGC